MSERQIDDAIDEAVRDLMNVDADPAFRGRVADRLRKPAPRAFFWRQVAVAAAAVAVTAGGFSVVREMRRSEPQPVNTASSAVTAPAPVPVRPSAEGRPMAGNSAASRRVVVSRPSGRVATHAIPRGGIVATLVDEPADPAELANVAETEPPDASAQELSIAPIEITAVAVTPIRQSEIVVAPLTPLKELVVAPLDARSQRE